VSGNGRGYGFRFHVLEDDLKKKKTSLYFVRKSEIELISN